MFNDGQELFESSKLKDKYQTIDEILERLRVVENRYLDYIKNIENKLYDDTQRIQYFKFQAALAAVREIKQLIF